MIEGLIQTLFGQGSGFEEIDLKGWIVYEWEVVQINGQMVRFEEI